MEIQKSVVDGYHAQIHAIDQSLVDNPCLKRCHLADCACSLTHIQGGNTVEVIIWEEEEEGCGGGGGGVKAKWARLAGVRACA